jgi:hypothetical protein
MVSKRWTKYTTSVSKEEKGNYVGAQGLQKLFEDLQVDPSDIVTLVLAWKLQAKSACEFTETEFVDGLANMQVDSLEKLKKKLSKCLFVSLWL